MKIVKRFLAIVSLLLIVFAAGCSTSKSSTTKNSSSATSTAKARSLDAIKKSGTIKIGVFSDKNRLAMLMTKENTKDMMFILQTV